MADSKGIEANTLEAAATMAPFLLQSTPLCLSNSADAAVVECETVAIIRQQVTSSALDIEQQRRLRKVKAAVISTAMGCYCKTEEPSL
jgi:hypothetical protein